MHLGALTNLLVVSLLSLTLTGCMTMHLDAEVDQAVTVTPAEPVYVSVEPDAAVFAKNFRRLLADEMKKAGINVVAEKSVAKLALLFEVRDHPAVTSTSTITGTVGASRFSATSVGTTAVPVTGETRIQRIYLMLWRLNPMGAPVERVWDGYLGADAKLYECSPRAHVRKLLAFYGKTFKGDTAPAYSKTDEAPPGMELRCRR